ncbi:MAG: hypothetical protein J2P48_09950 [Alphaproteobacteria bacterium]|nr:hypothetical protein [Alphaproteobacteria bacterium]
MNTRHWMSVNRLAQTGGPVELSSGDRTERYRTRLGLLKTHTLDAVCAGSLETVLGWDVPVLQVGCAGRRACQRTRLTAHGFARGSPMRARRVRGVQTGDTVRAIASGGKKAGVIIGRSAIRASGSFNAQTTGGALQGICWQYCQGWTTPMATPARYETMRAAFLPHA